MVSFDGIRKSGDVAPILVALGVILIIVGLTMAALSLVWGYVVLGVGLLLIAAKIFGYF